MSDIGGEGASDKDPTQDPYKVGYKKPPQEYRFKKGKSGNPSGKPKRPKPYKSENVFERESDAILREELNRQYKVKSGNREKRMSAKRALIRQNIQESLRGNRACLKLLMAKMDRIEAGDVAQNKEYFEVMATLKREESAVVAKARKEGKPEPIFEIHPDDIDIDFVTGRVHVRRMYPFEAIEALKKLIAMRDEVIKDIHFYINAIKEEPEHLPWRESLKAREEYLTEVDDLLPEHYRTRPLERIKIKFDVREALSTPAGQKPSEEGIEQASGSL